MALPKVTIKYLNGLLGTTPESQDGLLAMVVLGAAEVSDTFVAGKPYKIYGESSLASLGITEDNNEHIVELVRQFYKEAPEGTPMYIVTYAGTMQGFFNSSMRGLIESLKGEVRGVVVSQVESYEPGDGMAEDVITAIPLAQQEAEYCAETLYAPCFVILEGLGYTSASDLPDMSENEYNRVAVVLGSTSKTGEHAAVGTLAGRIAAIPIQRNIGAVLDGALAPTEMYLGANLIDNVMDDVRTIHDKGYIVPRVHIGRTGYFYTDDSLCCDPTDDYAHLTARRTVDKAARIAYDTLLDYLLSEIEVNEDGTMQLGVIKSWQAAVETSIDGQMTSNGELSAINGSGCKCVIDASQNILATSKINVVLKVRPYGYAREIVCELGFLTNNA